MFSIFNFSTTFLIYVAATISVVLALILHFEPCYGQSNMLVYLGICSLMGWLTVIMFVTITILKFHIDNVVHDWLLVWLCSMLNLWNYSGCEREGHWNCNKAYTWWNKPNSLSSNLVFSYHGHNMCHYTVELPEQGEPKVIGFSWCNL